MRFKFYIFKFFFILDFRVNVRLKYDISLDKLIFWYVSFLGIKVRIDIDVYFFNLNFLKFCLLWGYKIRNIIMVCYYYLCFWLVE